MENPSRVQLVLAHVGEDELDGLRLTEAASVVRSRAEHEFAEPVRRGLHPFPLRWAAILLAGQSRGEVGWRLIRRL